MSTKSLIKRRHSPASVHPEFLARLDVARPSGYGEWSPVDNGPRNVGQPGTNHTVSTSPLPGSRPAPPQTWWISRGL